MADAPGKDTPPTDPKLSGKSGAVKPPVLEGSARPVDDAKATEKPTIATKPAADKPSGTTDKANVSMPTAPAGSNGGALWTVAFGGGVVGLAAAYGLAFFGLWPTPPQTPQPADPRIGQFASAIPELQTVTSTVQDELSTLTARLSRLETSVSASPAPAQSADSSAFAEQLDALSARIDALAANPATAAEEGESVNAEALAALQQDLDSLREQSADAASRLSAAEAKLTGLAEQAGAAASAETELARLPLIFSGLESAFGAGRPYEDALVALRRAQPEAAVPATIADHAATGLPRPDEVARRLQAVIPDMLAGRPATADAAWQDTTLDWFRGLVAMRPAEALDGTGPEAGIARLEQAIAQRDFASAQAELAGLPETMRDAAASVAGDIAVLADAANFLDSLRAAALNGEAGE